MTREEKEQVVADISKIFSEAKGVYLTDFTGINVDTINKLRSEFRENNVNYTIVKNTLTRLSVKNLSLDDLRPHLDGPTALAFSYDDALIPGKLIAKFQKKTELMPIKAALIEGTIYDQSMTMKIVNLPTRDELIAKMLTILNSPMSGLVMVMNGVLRNLVGVLDSIRSKKESEGDIGKQAATPADSGDKQKELEKPEKPDSSEATAEPVTEQESADESSNAEKTEDDKEENKEKEVIDEAPEDTNNNTEEERNKEE